MKTPDLKKAAYRLCELRGTNPEELVGHGHPEGYAVLLHSPRWLLVQVEIQNFIDIQQAIQETTDG